MDTNAIWQNKIRNLYAYKSLKMDDIVATFQLTWHED